MVTQQTPWFGKSVQKFEKETSQQVTLDWTSVGVNVHVDASLKTLDVASRWQEKFANVRDVKVSVAREVHGRAQCEGV